DSSALPVDCKTDIIRTMMPYALKNLLRNAFKYAQSKITIHCEIAGNRVCIYVDDDGIGIPESERERVFHAFTRLDRSRDRTTGGHGLGLAIVRRVLAMHHGTAKVEDSPLGGARFTICWPLTQNSSATPCYDKT
ncbi:MAG: two-component sensor histidine kinase, partial [Proteobacteria bacterium]|nr:two-component sensor histidine kinase [Pseudomonadota bacterium]